MNRNPHEQRMDANRSLSTFTPKKPDVGPVTQQESHETARHWARYAHRTSLVFQEPKTGHWYCLAYRAAAIKHAMLTVGTAGKMWARGEGGSFASRVGWSEALVRLRNARVRAPL